MSVRVLMQDGRRLAAELLIDEGTITRPGGGAGTIDPVTGDYTPSALSAVYSGACRVRKPDAITQQVVFGDVSATVARYVVNLPYDAPLMQVGDVFTLTSSDDPEILNVGMRVASVVGKSALMYRQLGIEVIE